LDDDGDDALQMAFVGWKRFVNIEVHLIGGAQNVEFIKMRTNVPVDGNEHDRK
jgi:hypothetical protein